MRVETREKTIPEYKVKTRVFIAIDGQEFVREDSCREHERKLGIANRPVITGSVDGAETLDGYTATLYNIQNDDDFGAVLSVHGVYGFSHNYDQHGPGWYISYNNGGDYENRVLLHYDSYIEEARKEFERVTDLNKALIDSKRKEDNT